MLFMTDQQPNFALLGDRIAHALKTSGINIERAAVEIGVTRPAIDQWASGSTKNLKLANLFKLAKLTGFSAEWIGNGTGPMLTQETAREQALLDLYRQTDERGQQTIFRVAEQESGYAAQGDGTDASAA